MLARDADVGDIVNVTFVAPTDKKTWADRERE
jgi:hypothetical protein